jgi:hypothetical protein
MPRHRTVLVSAITATVLPVLSVYAADPAPASRPESASAVSQPILPTPSQPAAVPAARPESWSAPGLNFDPETVPYRAFSRRDGLAGGAASSSPLKVTPANPASRTGWQFSGRVGPVRWLTPLEGEGETRMRFGGRVPGQPRMPGMGLFNVGVHYTFE